jgi:uncharacterized phage-associated protein
MGSFNKEKFEELLHYIIHKCGYLENIGKTTLYKILYFCDFDYYEQNETSITGETYIKLLHGPAPKHFDKTITNLKIKKMIHTDRHNYHGHNQEKFLCDAEPKLSHLTAQEKLLVDKVIGKLCNMNATQISSYSHLDMPWKATNNQGIIKYELVFYRDPAFSVRQYPPE